MATLKNPFKFGDPVEGSYYLPRPNLEKAVRLFLENKIHVVLIGPRRFGKTSFVLNLLDALEKEKYTCLFVDIFNITSHKDFLQQILRAVRGSQSWMKVLMESIPKLRPKVAAELDPETGTTSFQFTIDRSSEKDVKETIQDVLLGLEKLGDKVIVVLDEFQKITEIDDGGWLEATLRTHMQKLKKTAFLFTGSRKSIIYDMLNNHTRPLYRFCQSIEFPSFGEEFTSWILAKLSEAGVHSDVETIEHLRRLVQDIPNYVQMICFHLVAEGKTHVGKDEIEMTLERVVRQNVYAYQTLLNSLTLTQQRTLRLAANEKEMLFSKELLERYEIASGPALASALKALKEKGILDEQVERGSASFDDPLLAFWLMSNHTEVALSAILP